MSESKEQQSMEVEDEDIMTDDDLEQMDDLLDKYRSVVEFIPRFEEWKEKFSKAMECGISQEPVKKARSWIRRLILALSALNFKFNELFERIPYQHPWLQEREMELLLCFKESALLHENVVSAYKETFLWLETEELKEELLPLGVLVDPEKPI